MNRTIMLLPLALAACGHTQTVTKLETVEVLKPVPVACVTAAQIPREPPLVGDQLNGDSGHDLDIVSASAIEVRKSLRVALALLIACKGD